MILSLKSRYYRPPMVQMVHVHPLGEDGKERIRVKVLFWTQSFTEEYLIPIGEGVSSRVAWNRRSNLRYQIFQPCAGEKMGSTRSGLVPRKGKGGKYERENGTCVFVVSDHQERDGNVYRRSSIKSIVGIMLMRYVPWFHCVAQHVHDTPYPLSNEGESF